MCPICHWPMLCSVSAQYIVSRVHAFEVWTEAAGRTDLCLLTPRNWEEQVASPVLVRTRRRLLVLALDPPVGLLAQDMASVSLPLSAASGSPAKSHIPCERRT